ncbi:MULTISPECIES: amino acid ABC transporter permease [unclassified Campylobacter]|uniref:amino acid ABC transporter permease n=1 Tax=unclassified Campylobacter TaxID=2593542 RepID=UPI001BDB1729|nr:MULTISPECIES: amino acid ABC transporter permease [unclassified Campylobacter]MBZ7975457.1 amino acid ABC transporter permease [Campylobacter sp. RM12637]MBZ7977290.1 amino acid ABC transporter permease [Campylobacter sp. RM12654]MBZ7979186.1 amino acid ABC transporter permease [Campylobacter sp. RM12642]MBZ7990349.1 amino acid ABC transporter permease [Campylobacter sp. RM9331]MBZ7992757.1 amino acid ABC transporter permease [Campylobacter sp. RM9333]MBZ8004866.1 amino acid ABC transporte
MSEILFDLSIYSRLYEGLKVTLFISFVSIFFSIIGGLVLGVFMSLGNKIIFYILKIILEIIRFMPIIVWLFLIYFGMSSWLSIDAISATIIVFVIWGMFEMMDLVRGAITSIPKHQFESSIALALSKYQMYRYIILPLALKRLIPNVINLLSRMIKTTSVAYLIGVVDILAIGNQLKEVTLFISNLAPLYIYTIIFFIYFIICYPLSKISKILEKRWS